MDKCSVGFDDIEFLIKSIKRLGLDDYELQYIGGKWSVLEKSSGSHYDLSDGLRLMLSDNSCFSSEIFDNFSEDDFNRFGNILKDLGISSEDYSSYLGLRRNIINVLDKYNFELTDTYDNNSEKVKGLIFRESEFIITFCNDDVAEDTIRLHGYIDEKGNVCSEHFAVDSNEHYLSVNVYKAMAEVLEVLEEYTKRREEVKLKKELIQCLNGF